jgi:predicted NBD/HSP70 family sugar kinase
MQVRNQTYLRRKNKEEIVKLLRDQSRSYSDIARALQLSNAAIAKIADDLISDNIIRRESDIKGRSGITLSVNAEFGYVLVIDFSRWQINICASDFASRILAQRTVDCVNLDQQSLAQLLAVVHELTKSESLRALELKCIAIATPGKIDAKSGRFILNPRFKNLGEISLQEVFEREFSCRVVVKNDINLALAGEKMYGEPLRDVNNALMLHIDVGTGAALLINGKVYEGSHGFAGEVGFFKLNLLLSDNENYGNMTYSNYYDSISLFGVLGVIQREVAAEHDCVIGQWLKESGGGWEDITIQMMIKAYNLGDPLVVQAINSSARVVGAFVNNIAELLDVDKILLNGSVIDLGEPYLKAVSKCAGGHHVVFSGLRDKATVMGAINAGILAVIQDVI